MTTSKSSEIQKSVNGQMEEVSYRTGVKEENIRAQSFK